MEKEIRNERLEKCIEQVFGKKGRKNIFNNGERCEGWSITIMNPAYVDSFKLEKLRLRFNTEFRDELEKIRQEPLAYWFIREIGTENLEIRYIYKGYYANEPEEVKDVKTFYE